MDCTHHNRCNIEASLLVHPPPLREYNGTPHTQTQQNQQDNDQERYDYPQGYGRGVDASRGGHGNCVTCVTAIVKLTTCSTEGGIVWTKTAGSWWTRGITRGSTYEAMEREGGEREEKTEGQRGGRICGEILIIRCTFHAQLTTITRRCIVLY